MSKQNVCTKEEARKICDKTVFNKILLLLLIIIIIITNNNNYYYPHHYYYCYVTILTLVLSDDISTSE